MNDARLRVVERSPGADVLRDLGDVIAEWLAPGNSEAVDVELRAADGSDIRIDRQGDALTIRGVVLTIRRADQPAALAGSRKIYY